MKKDSKRQGFGKRINPERKFYIADGAEDLPVCLTGKRVIVDKEKKERTYFEGVALEKIENGLVDDPSKPGTKKRADPIEKGERVLIGTTATLTAEELDPHVQRPVALLICPCEMQKSKNNRNFRRFEIYARDLNDEEKGLVTQFFHSEV